MDKILLVICNGLSCFIICTILFQFLNERYKKSYSNKELMRHIRIVMAIHKMLETKRAGHIRMPMNIRTI